MMNIIGENIKILRERMGLSQTNIAQFLNFFQQNGIADAQQLRKDSDRNQS